MNSKIKIETPGKFYAVQKDQSDSDWGTGSYDLVEAVKMMVEYDCERIAVIDTDFEVCDEEYDIADLRDMGYFDSDDPETVGFLIRKADHWELDDCEAFCKAAGLEKEWEEDDGDSFEDVLRAAQEKLGIDIGA